MRSALPAPLISSVCLNEELSCFPVAGGVMINPTNRLALLGSCDKECEGDLTYEWYVLGETDDVELKTVRLFLVKLFD